MIIQIIQDLDATIEFVHEAAKHTHSTNSFDWIQGSARKHILKPYQPWVCNRYTKEHNQMFRLSLENLSSAPVKYYVVRRLTQNFISLSKI